MGKRTTRWSKAPSWDPNIKRLKIKRLGLAAMRFFIISPSIEGLMTHFVDGHTIACVEKGCEHCEKNRASRWVGYLEVLGNRRSHFLFEVTEGLYFSLWKQAKDILDLRGLFCTAYREWGEKRAPILGKVHDNVTLPDDFPEPLDLREQLERIWRTDQFISDNSPVKLDGGFGS